MTKKIGLSLFWLTIFFILCSSVWGQDIETQVAYIIKTKGTVMVYQHHSKKWLVAKKGTKIFQRDKLKTLSGSEVDLLIKDIAVVRLKENTILELAKIQREATKPVSSSKISLVEKRPSDVTDKNILRLLKGRLLLLVKLIFQDSTFEVQTPIGIAGVRGTRFMVSIPDQDTTEVAVLKGIIEVKNIEIPDKTVLVSKKEISIIRKGAYPSKPRRVNEQEYRKLKETLKLSLLGRKEKVKKGSYNRQKDASINSEYMGGHVTTPSGSMPRSTSMGGGGSMGGGSSKGGRH